MRKSRRLSYLLADLLMSFSIIALSEFGQSEKAQFAHTQKSTHHSKARGAVGKTRDRLVVMNTDRRWLSSIVSL